MDYKKAIEEIFRGKELTYCFYPTIDEFVLNKWSKKYQEVLIPEILARWLLKNNILIEDSGSEYEAHYIYSQPGLMIIDEIPKDVFNCLTEILRETRLTKLI